MPRKKQRRAWGSVTEIKRGKKYVLRWIENTSEGRKRKTRTVYGTYREACAALDIIHAEKREDHVVPTLGEAFLRWYMPWIKKQRETGKYSENTEKTYLRAWEKDCADRWDSVPIDSVKPADVQEWLDGKNKGSARFALTVMRKTADLAIMYAEPDCANRFRNDYMLPGKSYHRKTEIYDLATANAVLDRIKGDRSEAPFILACFSSCRVGESLAVRSNEVLERVVDGEVFAVTHIVRRADNANRCVMPDGQLKTPESVRWVITPPPYGERLLEIARERQRDGWEWLADRGDGIPMVGDSIGYYFKRAAGDDAVPFKNLRSSWRTIAEYEWRISQSVLEPLMGHKMEGVTGKHYLRPDPDMLLRAFADDYFANNRTV